MGTKGPNELEWLQAERKGQDELAEAMFARLMAEIPAVEPSAGFVDRTVQLAWRARTRRRLVARFALATTAILLGIACIASIYELRPLATGIVAGGALLLSHGFAWLITFASEGAGWWWIAERIGTAVSEAIASPSMAATIVAVELIALLALYAFRDLLRQD